MKLIVAGIVGFKAISKIHAGLNARLTRVRKKIHNFCFLLNHVMEDFQCSCEMLLIIAAHIYVGLTSSISVLNSGYRSCYNFRRQTAKPPKNTCFNIRATGPLKGVH